MQIRSKRNKLIITALDKEGMALLIGGEYERVCALCAAAYDEKSRELLDELVNERLPTDVVEEGGVLWNTLWIGVNSETGRFIGAVRMLGKPNEKRELHIALHPVEKHCGDPLFARVFERVCEWILNHRAVYYLLVEPIDEPQISFLRRYQFVQSPVDGVYVREKNRPAWILIGLCLGLATGVLIADAFGGMSLGMAVGALFGLVIGWLLDSVDIMGRRTK